MLTSTSPLLAQSPYQSYVYGYPHKTAYRPLASRTLAQVWQEEDPSALCLYIHIPFCEMRCGFCNLFTTVSPNPEFVDQYLATLKRQAKQVRTALGDARFARFALGGGTPTQLTTPQLVQVLDIAESIMGVDLRTVPSSVEVSPATASAEKLEVLNARCITRMSMGVQSFVDTEALSVQRRQQSEVVQNTLERIRTLGVPILNLDLIYGLPDQTPESWLYSLQVALQFQPEELYLYPLYVRPLTGLGVSDREWDDHRLTCYRVGREFLLANGYTQVSMRMFRGNHAPDLTGPVYCCQADGMVGLGCGARSYTKSLHYANDYAVGAKAIRNILDHYIHQSDQELASINYGVELDQVEQQRRFLLLSLLAQPGLNFLDYQHRFGSSALADFPELLQLVDWGLAQHQGQMMQLTALGLERSDAIGPWLFSESVQKLIQTYEVK
jgi:oxygen-independent coproporphyrinogen III oxidase